MSNFTSYELSRNFFNFCFENTGLVKPNHIALYFYIIEHFNRLGWKTKVGLPAIMVREILGMHNFRTYDKTLNDLVNWKFIKIHSKSTNQYTATIISLISKNKNKITTDKSHLTNSINLNSCANPEEYPENTTEFFEFNNSPDILKATNKRITAFTNEVLSFKNIYDKKMLLEFIKYWSAISNDQRFFKAETIKTFSIQNRLVKWKELETTFKNKTNETHKSRPAADEEIINTLNAKFSHLSD